MKVGRFIEEKSRISKLAHYWSALRLKTWLFLYGIFFGKNRTETALIKFLASILSLDHRNDMIFDELGDDKRWNYS